MENRKALALTKKNANMLLAMAIKAEEKEVKDELNLENYLANLKLKGKVEEEKVEEKEGEEKWLKYYSSKHKILLVGEGDFSFSLCLARAFGSASNIVATSLDSYDELLMMYTGAGINLRTLRNLGAFLLHEVNASSMKRHSHLKQRKFDRIIFNFPHAGFELKLKENDYDQIERHQEVVSGFFKNARCMLQPNGEVHVNHKTGYPYCHWDLEGLARKNSLVLFECIEFDILDYPCYRNKRGARPRCNQPFPLGSCSTFKFKLST